jgi:hypothetical protein
VWNATGSRFILILQEAQETSYQITQATGDYPVPSHVQGVDGNALEADLNPVKRKADGDVGDESLGSKRARIGQCHHFSIF